VLRDSACNQEGVRLVIEEVARPAGEYSDEYRQLFRGCIQACAVIRKKCGIPDNIGAFRLEIAPVISEDGEVTLVPNTSADLDHTTIDFSVSEQGNPPDYYGPPRMGAIHLSHSTEDGSQFTSDTFDIDGRVHHVVANLNAEGSAPNVEDVDADEDTLALLKRQLDALSNAASPGLVSSP